MAKNIIHAGFAWLHKYNSSKTFCLRENSGFRPGGGRKKCRSHGISLGMKLEKVGHKNE
jgi:hypothetical protein